MTGSFFRERVELLFTSTEEFAIVIIATIAVAAIYFIIQPASKSKNNAVVTTGFGETQKSGSQQTANNGVIEPLHGFDYSTINPIDYRPFKNMQHVAMGIKMMPISEWIRIDRGYVERLEERKQVMREHPKEAFGSNDIVDPAIEELHDEIMVRFLPQRFPTTFQVVGDTLHNKITGQSYVLDKSRLDPVAMLRNLGENVEEDFYIMCPDAEDELRLQGYIACFPGGFLSPSRVGMSMREIHDPVPGYNARIGKGADKFLARMEPGVFVERMNWSLQTDGVDLFRVDGNNFYPEQGHVAPPDQEALNIGQCYLRVEHQTLTRLQRTRAVIFCVRSYMTPLHEIKSEGNGPLLADAIESMPEKLGDYKKRPFWDKEVYAYLRG